MANPPPLPNKNLIACKDCGAAISKQAKNCPQCGAPAPKQTGGCALLVAVFGVVFIIGVVSSSVQQATMPQAQQDAQRQAISDEMEGAVAWRHAVKEVTSKLKAPSTAKFPSSNDAGCGVSRYDAKTFACKGWVDSQNSFGAMIRTEWLAVVDDASNEVLYLNLGGEKFGQMPEKPAQPKETK